MRRNLDWTWTLAGLLCAVPVALAAGDAAPRGAASDAPYVTADHPGGGHGGPGMHGRGMRGRGMHGEWGPRMMEALDLTAQQREKIAGLREAEERKSIQARADLRLAALDLRKLMRAEKTDQRAINSQIDRVSGMRAAMQKSRVATMLSIRGVLTDEQRTKLREMREQGPPVRDRGGRGRGPGRGPGGSDGGGGIEG